jgi:transcriptional regulator EpsA
LNNHPNSPDLVPGSTPTVAGKNVMAEAVLDLSAMDQAHFVATVRESLHIKCHFQLLLWLQGEFQRCVPHQIFIAVWGDFANGAVQHDLVSAIPGIRTGQIANKDINRFTGQLFNRWVKQGAGPYGAIFEGLKLGSQNAVRAEIEAFRNMHSVLVHGIHDERGRTDCLYVFLNSDPGIAGATLDNLRVTLPFVDAAMRQVAHLPSQYPVPLAAELDPADFAESQTDSVLSDREQEIMNWVKQGKTNYETGIILNISTFTVKNHLQRIFRKLNVTNRAQAVSKLQMSAQELMAEPNALARGGK